MSGMMIGPRRLLATAVAVLLVSAAGAPPVGTADEDDFSSYPVYADGRTAGGWKPCPNVSIDERPITGGCVAKVRAPMRFRILTPFGPVAFARCDLRFAIHVGYEGTVALDGIETEGGNPCGDIRACLLETDSHPRPWVGKVVPGDGANRYVLRLDACLDTCAGWFEGPIELALRRSRGRWRMRAARTQIGYTGLEVVSSDARLAGNPLSLRTTPR